MDDTATTTPQAPEEIGTSTPSSWDEDKIIRIIKAAKKHFDHRRTFDNKFRELYFNKKEVDSDTAPVNFMYATVKLLQAVIYTIAPRLVIQPRANAGGGQQYFQALMQVGLVPDNDPQTARRIYADSAKEVEDFAFAQSGADEHIAQTVLEVLLTGMGVVKHSFDDLLGIERTDCLMRHEVFFDPEARFRLDQCRYVVHSHSMPLNAAKRFFIQKISGLAQLLQKNNINPAGAQNPLMVAPDFDPMKLEANETLAEATGEDDTNITGVSEGKEWLRFYEIWSNDEGERWVWYALESGLGDKRILFRQPWPFTLETRQYPFSILVFNRLGKQINDAFSEQHVVAGLRRVYQRWADFLRRLADRSIGKVLLIDESKIDSAKQDKIKDGTLELQVIGVDAPTGGDVSKAMYVVNLNQGDDKLVELQNIVKQWIDEILGVDELLRGADDPGTPMTATEAKVRDDMLRVRQSERETVFDKFLADIFTKRLCIARQKMQPDKVMKIAGPAAAIAWELNSSYPDDFALEYDVDVEAGSTAMRHKEDMVNNFDTVIQKMAAANQMQVQLGQPPVFDIIEAVKEQLGILKEDVQRFELHQQPFANTLNQPQSGAMMPPMAQPMQPNSQQQQAGAGTLQVSNGQGGPASAPVAAGEAPPSPALQAAPPPSQMQEVRQ